MSSTKSPKTPKTQKFSKSSKSEKEIPNLEFICKYRGKYDLSKNQTDNDFSIEYAVNLFEWIYQKSERIYKNTKLKMFKEKKSFYFVEYKSLTKARHNFLYSQVRKFYVLHKAPTIVLMGVHHKTHRWFLVFQFLNTEDLKKFCDEIEGENKKNLNEKEIGTNHMKYDEKDSASNHVPEIHIEENFRKDSKINNDDFEKISIHSDKYNEALEAGESNLNDIYLVSTLSTENLGSQSSFIGESTPAMSSSRNSLTSVLDEKYFCDNLSNSRLKDIMVSSGNAFSDFDDCEENLTVMEYPKEIFRPQLNKIGSVYIYYARHKLTHEEHIKRNYSSLTLSDEEDNASFDSYNAKFISGGKTNDEFQNHNPKMISRENSEENVYNHEPKMNHSEYNGFGNYESKMNGK